MEDEHNRKRLNQLLNKLESQNDVLDKLLKKINKEVENKAKSAKIENKK